jgi:hypothetical protein
MAFDPVRGRVITFAGRSNDTGESFGDIWEWNGTTWANVVATGPSGRFATSLVYNGDAQRTIMFGNSPDGIEDMWEWSGTGWSQRTIDTQIPTKYRNSTAYDAARHNLVTFGGRDVNFNGTGTTQLITYRPNESVESCLYSNVDYDRDGRAGCQDDDCWAVCTPLCPPGTAGGCATASPRCGDGTCSANEDCNICPSDCGVCTGGLCGDFYCNTTTGESVATCPHDCRL